MERMVAARLRVCAREDLLKAYRLEINKLLKNATAALQITKSATHSL